MTLTPGWNQIGNPYPFPISWDGIKNHPSNSGLSIQNNLRLFSKGSFVDGTGLAAFQGGFIFVNGGSVLTFPAVKSIGGRSGTTPKPERFPNSAIEWLLPLKVKNDKAELVAGGIGMSPEGRNDFDSFDDFTLPRISEFLELNHEKTLHGVHYSTDFVATADQMEWSFTVESSETSSVHTLSWPKPNFLDQNNKLILWDVKNARPIDMMSQESYTFQLPATFKIFYGADFFINEKIGLNSFRVFDPSPNPSSGKFGLPIYVPESLAGEQVEITITDLQGKSIVKPVSFNVNAGFQVVQFGKQSDSMINMPGFYILRCEIQGFSRAIRILINQ